MEFATASIFVTPVHCAPMADFWLASRVPALMPNEAGAVIEVPLI